MLKKKHKGFSLGAYPLRLGFRHRSKQFRFGRVAIVRVQLAYCQVKTYLRDSLSQYIISCYGDQKGFRWLIARL
jgi:hypothetical protein